MFATATESTFLGRKTMTKLPKEQELVKAIQEGLRFLVIRPRSKGDKVYEKLLELSSE